ncbi:MAG: hypothetical protein ACRCUX_12335, partial [Beijerinckiaceae bacterium]
PDIINGNTAAALSALGKRRVLQKEQFTNLYDGYVLMRDVQHWQRLTMQGKFDSQTAGAAVLQRIANAANAPDYRVLQAQLSGLQHEIRSMMNGIADGHFITAGE